MGVGAREGGWEKVESAGARLEGVHDDSSTRRIVELFASADDACTMRGTKVTGVPRS